MYVFQLPFITFCYHALPLKKKTRWICSKLNLKHRNSPFLFAAQRIRDKRQRDAFREHLRKEKDVEDAFIEQYGPPPTDAIPTTVTMRQQTVCLPVSTRGTGFTNQHFKLRQQPIQNFNITIHQFYRANLVTVWISGFQILPTTTCALSFNRRLRDYFPDCWCS